MSTPRLLTPPPAERGPHAPLTAHDVAQPPPGKGRRRQLRTITLGPGTGGGQDLRAVTMTARALSAFVEYRDLGPTRSLKRLAEISARRADPHKRYNLRTLEGYSHTFGWQDLVRVYDQNLAVESAQRSWERRVTAAQNRKDTRLTMAHLAYQQAFDALKARDPAEITPTQAVALIRMAIDIEAEDSGDRELVNEAPPSVATMVTGITTDVMEEAYNKMDPARQAHFLEVLRQYEESFRELQEFVAQ